MKMPSSSFDYLTFERKVNNALKIVERILDVERSPRLAGDVDHSYGAKYDLVNKTANAAIIAYMNALEKMGLDVSVLKSIDTSKATTLRFDGYTACKFVKEVVVDLPSEVSYSEEHEVKSSSAIFGNSKKTRVSKVCHIIVIVFIIRRDINEFAL